MPVPVFAGEQSGNKIYRVGRVGFDSGNTDAGGAYTGTLRTEKISPLGESGLCYFRRVVLRVFRTGAFTVTFKVYVDGAQTKIFNASSQKVDQTIVVTKAAPTISPDETIVEGEIAGKGTYIEVEMTILSTDGTGVFLPEELEVHFQPLREARVGSAESQ